MILVSKKALKNLQLRMRLSAKIYDKLSCVLPLEQCSKG